MGQDDHRAALRAIPRELEATRKTVRDLAEAARKDREKFKRTIKWLVAGLAFAVAFALALAVVTTYQQAAISRLERENIGADVRMCQSFNVTRAQAKTFWVAQAALDARLGPAGRAAAARITPAIPRVYVPAPCEKLARR